MTYTKDDIKPGNWVITQSDGAFSTSLASWGGVVKRKVGGIYKVKSVNKLVVADTAYSKTMFGFDQIVAVFESREQALAAQRGGSEVWNAHTPDIDALEIELRELKTKRYEDTVSHIKRYTNR